MGFQLSRIQTLEDEITKGKFRWLQDIGISTIIDVGANVGEFTIMIHKILSDAMIYSFEPINDCYKDLLENTKHISQVKCFNLALGRESKEEIMFRSEFSPSSSLLKMGSLHKTAFPYTKNVINEKIKIVALDEIRDRIDWRPKILLKIDVQGYELEVLKGAKSCLNFIDLIIVETSFYELYQNQPLFNDIFKFLLEKNYQYKGNFDQIVDPSTGRILQADAIFIKT
jgi:FkbM family methyltransferase